MRIVIVKLIYNDLYLVEKFLNENLKNFIDVHKLFISNNFVGRSGVDN